MKPMLEPPETKHLKLKCDILLSTYAFKFNLRRYTPVGAGAGGARRRHPCQRHGKAVQVDSIKLTLIAPGIKLLNWNLTNCFEV
jgi:hypothetical protein